MEVPKRTSTKIQVSKNKKKGWKKHSNIDDIEEFLEDKRFEERIGGPISEKPDENLFFVDKKESDNVFKLSKKKSILDDLKCFSALKNSSQVPPPIKVNCVQPSSKKRKNIIKKIITRKITQPKIKKENEKEFYDVWNAKENDLSTESNLDKDLIDYIEETTKKKPPKTPVHRYQKPSLLPAVEIPPSGTSYNPDYNDHTKLLLDVVKMELQYEKEHKKIERALTEKFPTIDEAPTEKTWLEEMSQGLKTKNNEQQEEENTEDSESSETDLISCNPPVRFDDKKSKQKRRKEMELKEKMKKKKQMKLENKRINEIYRLRSIKNDLLKNEERSQEKQMKKDQLLIEKMYQPRILSQYKYEKPDPEFNLREELTGELRTIKVVGNIMEDRYKSFQRRNIIEPRIRQK